MSVIIIARVDDCRSVQMRYRPIEWPEIANTEGVHTSLVFDLSWGDKRRRESEI